MSNWHEIKPINRERERDYIQEMREVRTTIYSIDREKIKRKISIIDMR